MADVNIALTVLTIDTRSADLIGSGSAVNAGQTFSIAATNKTDDRIIVLEELGAGAATVTFDAGDYPPSMRQGLGALAIALATSDVRILQLSGGRFIQSDGTITGSVATNNCRITAYKLTRLA